MPGIVVGNERKSIEGGPGELSKEFLARRREIVEEKMKQREEKSLLPDFDSKPETQPWGFLEPR